MSEMTDLDALKHDFDRQREVLNFEVNRSADLEKALAKCRERFVEYATSHRLRIEGALHSIEREDREKKAVRNEEMVDMIDAALAENGQ